MTSNKAGVEKYLTLDEEEEMEVENNEPRLTFGVNKIWEPSHGPHQVFVAVSIEMISAIDTSKQTFSCRFSIIQQFMMTRGDKLRIESKGFDIHDFTPEWKPPKLAFPKATFIHSFEDSE